MPKSTMKTPIEEAKKMKNAEFESENDGMSGKDIRNEKPKLEIIKMREGKHENKNINSTGICPAPKFYQQLK